MKLGAVARPGSAGSFGSRFYLVCYLPTYAATLFLLLLVWAGARGWVGRPGHQIRFAAAWVTASHLSVGEVIMVALTIGLLALIFQPLQVGLVKVAEGSWPAWLGGRWACTWQLSQKKRLQMAQQLPADPKLTDHAIQRAGAAGYKLRRRFPLPDHLIRPTALGNILAAMTDQAGRVYGLDAAIAWPRLYPVLGEQVRLFVDDRRDTLDATIRMTATMVMTTVASGILLLQSRWWILLTLIPLLIAVLAYSASLQAALAYSEAVHVAFDLHRADLLTALRMELPRQQAAERALNEEWCDLWRQGIPLPRTIEYSDYSQQSLPVIRAD
jgi:hypothetical protein